MARAQRRRTRQGGAGQGLPGWAMLTIGLIIGLFVAFLVYLDDLDAPQTSGAEPAGDGGVTAEGGAESERPRFEFYSILPELEVVVPDLQAPPGDEDAAGEAPPPAPDGATPATPGPGREGTFYLQAGSFKEGDQADRLRARITLLGLDVGVQTVRIDGERWHRVRVGPFTETASLRDAQQRLRENDIDYLVLRQKSSG